MIDALSSAPHYRAHLLPIFEALPPELRGVRLDRDAERPTQRVGDAVLVASFRDMGHAWHLGYRRIAYVEHGIGQSYIGLDHGAYPGGPGRDKIGLFLSPNDTAAARDRAAYPAARVEVIGDPVLDTLPERVPDGQTTVAVSFHWDWHELPETRSALAHYLSVLPDLAARFHVIGHGHPNAASTLIPLYQRLGIEWVSGFSDVCRRADVYVCDNSSTLYEFASTGRPVVVLNAPWYRRDVEHGLRFWEATLVGLNLDDPASLIEVVQYALDYDPFLGGEDALSLAYGHRSGAAARGAARIADWLGVAVAA